jgi:hypothetical protein
MGLKTSRPSAPFTVGRSNAVTNTAASIKTTGGELFGWYMSNTGAAVNYVKIYGKDGATSTDTPLFTCVIPAGAATNILWTSSVTCPTGISVRSTTDYADNSVLGSTANEVVVNIVYT